MGVLNEKSAKMGVLNEKRCKTNYSQLDSWRLLFLFDFTYHNSSYLIIVVYKIRI